MRPRIANSPAYRWGGTALFFAAAVILAALGFEHIGGMTPCPLCLQQRWAYYAGVPAAFVALVLLSAGHPRAAAVLFGLVGLAFLVNAGLGAYHAGIEWGFWPGPDTCAGTLQPLGSILKEPEKLPRIVRCDEVALGIVEAKKVLRRQVPMVVRLRGTNEERGRQILANANVIPATSLEEAARLAVAAARGETTSGA